MKAVGHRIKITALLICLFFGLFILVADWIGSGRQEQLMTMEQFEEFNQNWTIEVAEEEYKDQSLPFVRSEVRALESLILERKLPDVLAGKNALFFRASHKFVQVRINGEEVYQFGFNNQHLFGKTPGCVWVVVPITDQQQGASLEIELMGAYDRNAGSVNEVYIGTKSSVLAFLLKDRIMSFIACIVILTIGVSMLLISIILKNGELTNALFRLGMLTIITAVWSLCILNLLQLYIGDVFFLLNLEFLTFTLLLPFFIFFLQAFSFYKNQKVVKILFWMSILNFVVVEFLQLFGVADYLESIVLTHGMIGITVFYLFVNGIREMFRKEAPKEVKVFILTLIILLLFTVIDLYRFYFLLGIDEGFFTRVGLLVFILLWAVDIIKNISKVIAENAKAKLFEKMAYQDQMTGLQNRSAFEEKLSLFRELPENGNFGVIITFDMNGLKRINDQYGHAKGDEAIIEFANIIKTGFEDIGNCYRIGGDEICVIVEKDQLMIEEAIESRMNLIADKAKEAGIRQGTGFTVAGGYSKCRQDKSFSIDEAYKQADQEMYLNKERMKSQLITTRSRVE